PARRYADRQHAGRRRRRLHRYRQGSSRDAQSGSTRPVRPRPGARRPALHRDRDRPQLRDHRLRRRAFAHPVRGGSADARRVLGDHCDSRHSKPMCRTRRPARRGNRRASDSAGAGLAAEAGRYERRQLLLDELLDLRRVEDLDEGPQARVVLFVRPCREAQHQSIVHGPIDDQRRLRITARRDQIGDVDEREADVVERAIGLRRIELDDLQILRIVDDIEPAHRKALAGRQLDQPRTLEQDQAARAVQRLIRDRDAVAGFDLVERLDLLREQPDRRDHADLVDLHQVESALLVLQRKIGRMLEQIGVDIA
ncbi:hypothetical protein chiPu_0029041, partial [Chiloscyllium punctatum]|nr:hypothetical protein [Chiloscyllium punctatum]